MNGHEADDHTHARRRNVLILDNELGMGGVEKLVFNFVSNIDRSRFNIAVCCLKEGGFFKPGLESLGIHVYEKLLAHKYDAVAYNRLLRVIQKENVDLIDTFAHPNTVIFSAIARATRKVAGWIVSFHAMGSPAGGKLLHEYQKPFLKRADALVAVANKHKDYLVEVEGLDESQITVIHNGVDVAKYHPGEGKARIREGLGIRAGDIVVTTVASLKPAKCVGNLLHAVREISKQHDNMHCVVVGDGPDRELLRSMAEELSIVDRVTFTGIREDVPEILRASHIFVVSSRLGTETFPTVVLEAMASGLPVVSTDVGSVHELITDGVNGWIVPPDDIDALAATLEDLIGDPALAAAWGRRGREIVETNFRLESMCRKREALFDKVLGLHGSREKG